MMIILEAIMIVLSDTIGGTWLDWNTASIDNY